MFEIKQLETSACKTVYEVRRGDDIYLLDLWIITGGTPALNFSDHKGPTQRYPVRNLWRGTFSTRTMCFDHQDPDNIQGPMLAVLPEGAITVAEYLDYAIPLRAERLHTEAEARREKKLLDELGIESLPERTPEGAPRVIRAHIWGDKASTTGKDILDALKGAEERSTGAAKIGDVIVGVSGLRAFAQVFKSDVLVFHVLENRIEVKRENGHSTIKHGAWDKYKGHAGYTCELVFT